ncbi:MAG: flavodoxin family protein [Candidatus Saccharibacteria bacterium]
MKTQAEPKIHIVGLNGSPNKNGNTMVLLEEALAAASELGATTEILHCTDSLRGVKNPFCINCESPCSGKCYAGKPLEEAYQILSQADGLLIGSPVYFGTVSGQLKAFWDKSRNMRTRKLFYNIIGGAVTSGASSYGGQETTIRAIHDMMMVQGMIVVGDGYIENDCGHLGAMATRPAAEDQNARARARILGKRLAEVARATGNIRVGR